MTLILTNFYHDFYLVGYYTMQKTNESVCQSSGKSFSELQKCGVL